MKNREFRVPIRGNVLALFGRKETLTIATTHTEGFAVPLYHINLYTGEWKLTDLDFPLRVITGSKESPTLYAAGTDNRLYKIENKPTPLSDSPKEKILALKIQEKELFVLKENGLEIRNPTDGKILEQISLVSPSAFDLDPAGRWLAVGFEDGIIQAFSREEQDHFAPKEREKVHQSAVLHILFDPKELHVISTAADKQIMMTQLRGKLEVAERSSKGQEGAIHCLIHGPENTFFSAGDDNLKLWAAGHTRRAPFTTKVEGPVKAVSIWKMGETPVAALGKSRGMIFLMPLDKKNKPTAIAWRIYTIKSWARREFESVDTRLREGALKKLAEFPDLFTVGTIKDRAMEDSDPRLRTLAVNLLTNLKHKEVDEALINLLQSKDRGVHLTAFDHLFKRAKFPALHILTKAIITGYKELGLEALPRLAKLAVSDQQARNQLIHELGNKSFELRSAAFRGVQELHTGDPVQAVILGLNAAQYDIRIQALKLGYHRELLKNREFLRLIRRHLDDKNMEVRYSAFVLSLLTQPLLAETLRARDEDIQRRLHDIDGKKAEKIKAGQLPELNETLRTPLIEAMATPALDICLAGAKALALIKDPRAFGVLLQLSRESSDETRIAVCQAFSALGDPNAIPRLRLLLHDKKINVADAAFSALGKLLKDRPLLLPEAGLAAPDQKIRLQAIGVLAGLLKKAPLRKESLAFLEKALNDKDGAVRREAFKTLLNADLKQQRAETLRFALRSAHSDIRLEVVMELDSRKKEPWAREILAEMLNDADSFIRGECFSLLRQTVEESKKVFLKALRSEYEDVRSQALELLLKSKKKNESVLEMIFSCLKDSSSQIRRKALDGLIAEECVERLEQALESSFADVRVGAASAKAAYGIKNALPPLLEVIRSEEPEEKNERKEWTAAVKKALTGLSLLGDASAFKDLTSLIRNPKTDTQKNLAVTAARTIRFIAREHHKEELAKLFSTPDKGVKEQIGLAMAAVGDPRCSSEVFTHRNNRSLAAAMMLRHVSREPLYSFMDERDRNLRSRAFLLCLFTDYGERPDSPACCLAGLAASFLEIRLQAAEAMENYETPEKFLDNITACFNNSFNPQWEVSRETVEELALLVSLAPKHVALPIIEGLLTYKPAAKQEEFNHWWSIARKRYAPELKTLKAEKKETKATGTGDLLPLAVGTYVGILRLKDSSVRVINRLSALNRLAGVAARVPGQTASITTCLKVALHDNSGEVRNKAFEHLLEISSPEDLAAEAIATEYRDIARKAMTLLQEKGKPEETTELLKDIQLTFTNGLEEEANEVLVKQYGPATANTAALGARSETLRRLAVAALSNLYYKEEKARKALYTALKSTFKDVGQKTALFLSKVKDEAALPLLKEMLFSPEEKEVTQAVRGYQNLNIPSTALLMLECLEKNPKHPLGRNILKAAGGLGDSKSGIEALKLLEKHQHLRGDIYQALIKITGYDQKLKLERDTPENENRVVVDQLKPRPLNDKLLEHLLKTLTELGETSLLTSLIPRGAYCLVPEVDTDLASLSKFKDQGVREAALSAAALRLREFGSRCTAGAETLRRALGHNDANTKFLAAEGLALGGYEDGIQILLTGADMLPNIRHRERAVLALGKLANPRALDFLLRLSENQENALREAAVEALGYMKDTNQASRIFELLKEFVRGEQLSLILRALKGLRWFDSPEGWQIIRDAALKKNRRIQELAIELLSCDKDREMAIECLRKLIRSAHNSYIVRKTAEVLLKISGTESLEAYYDFLLSPAQGAISRAVPKYPERLCREGSAPRLLQSLEEIQENETFNTIKAAILQKDPLPIQEAIELLPRALPSVCEFILQILGRSRHPLPQEELEALGDKYWTLWNEKYKEPQKEAGLRQVLQRLAWMSGRLSVIPPIFRKILENGQPLSKSIRQAVLQALLDRKTIPLEAEMLPAVAQIASRGENELRPLAVTLLNQGAPGELEKIYPQLQNIPQTLGCLDFKEQAFKHPELLTEALEQGLLSGQFTQDDIPPLSKLLTEDGIKTKTRRAVLEVLSHMDLEKTEALLKNFAETYKKETDEETDLGKLARKLERRSILRRRKQKLQNNKDWLEVTV